MNIASFLDFGGADMIRSISIIFLTETEMPEQIKERYSSLVYSHF